MSMQNEHPIKAVVFDLDHTLFDRYETLRILAPQIRSHFADQLKQQITPEHLARVMIEADKTSVQLGWPAMYEEICRSGIFHTTPPLDVFENYVLELFGTAAAPLPFVKPMLAQLHREGYLLGLITNGKSKLQHNKLRLLELENSFDRILVTGDYGTNKPNSDVFRLMAEWLGCKTGEMVYIGDHPQNDVDASRRAGCIAVWIRTQQHWCYPQIAHAKYEEDTVEYVPDLIKEIERGLTEMKETMLQEVMTQPGQIEFRELPVPQPQKGQVLVKIKRIGVCGSDIHVYYGKHSGTGYPVTQGHEVSGCICAMGEDVTGLSVGQKVTIEPQVVCGKCYPCRHGKYNLCENLKVMGFQTTGAASEYFAVDAAKITPLPDSMSYNEGAMIEPLAVTVHAAKHFDALQGAKVAVLGCGPIGILLAQSCKAMGAAQVMITDVSDYRLQLAKQCGVDFSVNTRNTNFGDAMTEAFGPDKADVIYDCAGNDITIGQAIQYARKGSKIVLVAVFAEKAHVDLFTLNDHELNLDTTMMYRHEDYLDAIRFVEEGKVQLKPLMSKHFAFRQYLDAYRYIEANRETTMKVLIDVDPQEE